MESYNEAQKPDTSFSNFAGYYFYTITSWPWPILQWAIPKRANISGVGGVLTPCLAVLMSDMLGGLSLITCYIYAAIDAYRSAKRINEQNQPNDGEVQ